MWGKVDIEIAADANSAFTLQGGCLTGSHCKQPTHSAAADDIAGGSDIFATTRYMTGARTRTTSVLRASPNVRLVAIGDTT